MPLTPEERQQFLAEPHIAALSVAAPADRGPLTVPIWYDYTEGGDVRVLTGKSSRKATLIAEAGRFSLMVDRVEPTIRYVSVDGPVVDTREATTDDIEYFSRRYLPPDRVDDYVAMASADHGAQVVIAMSPQHWLSSDLGS